MGFAPDQLEITGGRGYFRPTGSVPLEDAAEMIAAAIAFARAQGIRELLVNVLSLTGLEPPTISQRFRFAEAWAIAAEGKVRVAMVARPELIDPNRFGITVAANRGLVGEVFVSEAEAVAWLDHLAKR